MSGFSVVFGCVMVLVIVLFNISSIARYYLKYVYFCVCSMVFATAPIPLMLLKPFDPRNALIPAKLLRMSARLLGLRWKVRGLENFDDTRGAVVLINHQSGLDLYVLAILWPLLSRCTVVSKKSLQYVVPFGTAAWLWGTVYIDRGATSARNALNQQTLAIRDEKRKLLLFPEGTRHGGDRLLPFRKGAFHVAVDARAPIIPVVVSKYHFLDSNKYKFGPGEIIIDILPSIETADVSKDDLSTLIDNTYDVMQAQFTKSSAETLAAAASRTKVN